MVLKDTQGNIIDTQITDTDGKYLFNTLHPNEYVVIVQECVVLDTQEEDTCANITTDTSNTVVLTEGQIYLEADFGFVLTDPEPICGNDIVEEGELCDGGRTCTQQCTYKELGSIGDTVWHDTDADGVQDDGEV